MLWGLGRDDPGLGEWSLTGVLGAAQGIPYIGAIMSALYVPSAGEGSDRVPGRDEFWYEEELRQKALTSAKATTTLKNAVIG